MKYKQQKSVFTKMIAYYQHAVKHCRMIFFCMLLNGFRFVLAKCHESLSDVRNHKSLIVLELLQNSLSSSNSKSATSGAKAHDRFI